jgi:hypothetical protein
VTLIVVGIFFLMSSFLACCALRWRCDVFRSYHNTYNSVLLRYRGTSLLVHLKAEACRKTACHISRVW